MDEAMEKVGALEGTMDGQESDRWSKVARIEKMLDQVMNVGGSEATDCKADTVYMLTAVHKDVMQDMYGSTPEARE